ncbi:MAG: DUF4344 domain-containing metallopeptidase [Rhizobiaceae bacterium]
MNLLGKFISISAMIMSLFGFPAKAQESLLPELAGLGSVQQKEAIAFIKGVVTAVLLHEAGHMLIHEFSLPVIGREEEEVDTFATVTLLRRKDDAFDQALMDSTIAWLLSSEAARAAGVEVPFWDDHAADEDRGYSTACLIYGREPKNFKAFADLVGLPQGRRENCSYEYETAVNGWDTILKRYESSGSTSSGFKVVYEAATSEDLRPYAEFVEEDDLFAVLETLIGQKYKLLPGITLRASSCGKSNAYWSSRRREILLCHELVRFHATLLSSKLSWSEQQETATRGNLAVPE